MDYHCDDDYLEYLKYSLTLKMWDYDELLEKSDADANIVKEKARTNLESIMKEFGCLNVQIACSSSWGVLEVEWNDCSEHGDKKCRSRLELALKSVFAVLEGTTLDYKPIIV